MAKCQNKNHIEECAKIGAQVLSFVNMVLDLKNSMGKKGIFLIDLILSTSIFKRSK